MRVPNRHLVMLVNASPNGMISMLGVGIFTNTKVPKTRRNMLEIENFQSFNGFEVYNFIEFYRVE